MNENVCVSQVSNGFNFLFEVVLRRMNVLSLEPARVDGPGGTEVTAVMC